MFALILLPFTLLRLIIPLAIMTVRLMFWMIVATCKLTVWACMAGAQLAVLLVAVLTRVTPWIVRATIFSLGWIAGTYAVLGYNLFRLVVAPIVGDPIQLYVTGMRGHLPNFRFRPTTLAIPTRKRGPLAIPE